MSGSCPKTGPAPGYRDTNNGMLYGIGQGGYYWVSTINNSRAYDLDFHISGITPQYSDSRVFGFPVRCLQE